MNYHSDDWIMDRLKEHYDEALQHFKEEQIVGVFLQGSQNYGLDYEGSDIDTKLIVVPDFKNICLNEKPVSTTYVRANEEHTDWKDIRLYMETFRKQNLNFLEILFTPYYILNPLYEDQWMRLVEAREAIAHMNPYRAVKSMKGIALEKYHAMKHEYPSKVDIIKKYGYDGKQVSHLIRVADYIERYIKGEPYQSCLHPSEKIVKKIIDYKMLDRIPLDLAEFEAKEYLHQVELIADDFCADQEEVEDTEMRTLLQDVSYNIMKKAIKLEFEME